MRNGGRSQDMSCHIGMVYGQNEELKSNVDYFKGNKYKHKYKNQSYSRFYWLERFTYIYITYRKTNVCLAMRNIADALSVRPYKIESWTY